MCLATEITKREVLPLRILKGRFFLIKKKSGFRGEVVSQIGINRRET